MKNKLNLFLLAAIALLFFRFFISAKIFAANDFPLVFKESRNFSPFWNIAWDYTGGGGIGASAFKTLWIDLYTNLVYFLSNSLSIPWWLSQRIFWILPFLLISIFSSYTFSKLFLKGETSRVISSVIYTFNTYILLIIGGGQFGIAFAYAFAPLVLHSLFKLFNESKIRNLVFSSLFSGIIIALDARISLLIFLISAAWYLFFVRDFKIKRLLYVALNFMLSILLNSYWILPILVTRSSGSILSQYESIEGVKFLSFSSFSNSLSLLHPNWPENIFGKVYFFRPEFLVIPIIAFSILLFKPNRKILFLGILAIVGAFLGKGTNEPFGQVYSFFFKNLPGFNLFRDSTKFFILIALSYSILIPYLLESFKKFKKISIVLFIIFWLFTLRPAWSGQLSGIFRPKEIPRDYLVLKNSLTSDHSFFRAMWFPIREKYGYFDPSHPAIDASVLYNTTNISSLSGKLKHEELNNLSVRYVLVPYDVDSEIFLKGRKYDNSQYKNLINQLDRISWLKRVGGYGKIAVFENKNYKDHFWSSPGVGVRAQFLNPDEYDVQIQTAKKGDVLVFSEGFDKNWILEIQGKRTSSSKLGNLNSFVLPESVEISGKVYYTPQDHVNLGLAISALTLIFSFVYLSHSIKNGKIRVL